MDQAEKLREILRKRNQASSNLIKKEDIEPNDEPITGLARVISISSGKGGVGKTNFAVNFSIALQNQGYKVAIIDADIGLGNVEIISGVSPKSSISDIIYSNKSILDIISEGPNGIKIISGGSGLKELVLMNDENFPILLKEIRKLQEIVDIIVIDTGAGISRQVLDFILASDELIVVGTPDPTSIMDSYVLIKSATVKGYNNTINIVSNMVSSKKEADEVYNKLNNASKNFLRVHSNYLGYIEKDNIISNAVKEQIPFVISQPNSIISKRLNKMANNLVNKEEQIDIVEDSFAEKLLRLFKMR